MNRIYDAAIEMVVEWNKVIITMKINVISWFDFFTPFIIFRLTGLMNESSDKALNIHANYTEKTISWNWRSWNSCFIKRFFTSWHCQEKNPAKKFSSNLLKRKLTAKSVFIEKKLKSNVSINLKRKNKSHINNILILDEEKLAHYSILAIFSYLIMSYFIYFFPIILEHLTCFVIHKTILLNLFYSTNSFDDIINFIT